MSWFEIVTIGVATFALRAPFLLGFRGEAHPAVARALRFVPAAVLPALAISATLGSGEAPLEPRLIAAAAAALVVWRTRSIALSMALGLAILWALQAIL